ncbi:response regulator transcription factor [Paenibacillus sp. N1-5-1-14]|uniref:response regulator transcription factor n=1 Tax=Paenibacillus radicibacter TaxID=2972488 RepID=UPI002159A97B|nr:response regulator transcription factor [Paenibacillus radicibacter]MCR8641229.1 response regulator transcription factor [Paenibacillus radicibacter]
MTQLLLLEDDESLVLGLEFSLQAEGYQVTHAGTVEACKQALAEGEFDIAILDVTLPDGNGYEVCSYIRDFSDMPILFLTAMDDEVNVVLGLDIGADDYLTKPFRVRELLSRIRAVLRRKVQKADGTLLKSGNIMLDVNRALLKKEDKEIQLSAQEYRLLLIFMNNPEKILSRDEIFEKLMEEGGEFFEDNTLSVYIKRLREKIERDVSKPDYIITQRGLGYRWDRRVTRE